MPDREKVIKELEECLSASCRGYRPRLTCPYNDDEWDIMRDALDLLKAQEAVSVEICGHMFTVKYGHCPKCNEGLDSEAYPHWCGYCGQAVKWE